MKRTTLLPALFVCLAMTANAQIPRFQHIIVIFQENRATDNLFQGLCVPPYGSNDSRSVTPTPNQYNIQTSKWLDNATATGVIEPLPVELANHYDLSHAHSAFVAQCDAKSTATSRCRMDGAAHVTCSGSCPIQPQVRYVDNSTGILNPYRCGQRRTCGLLRSSPRGNSTCRPCTAWRSPDAASHIPDQRDPALPARARYYLRSQTDPPLQEPTQRPGRHRAEPEPAPALAATTSLAGVETAGSRH